jgi:hypothetical protein
MPLINFPPLTLAQFCALRDIIAFHYDDPDGLPYDRVAYEEVWGITNDVESKLKIEGALDQAGNIIVGG